MKTINEIIKELVHELTPDYRRQWMNPSELEKVFDFIAEEQRKIDIDKACKWLDDNLYMDKREGLCIGTYDDAKDDMIADFRRAMGKE